MKKYKFTYSKLIISLLVLGIALAVGCIALNLYHLIIDIRGNYEIAGYNWFRFILIFALSILFIVIAVACFISSYYTVDGKTLVLTWGIIKNKFDLNEITNIKYYKDKNRLELIFKDESYFYVATKPQWANEIINDIKLANSKIMYVEESSPTNEK